MSIPFIREYLAALRRTLSTLPAERIDSILRAFHDARERDAQVFVVGNGGSAATASHFPVDLGRGSASAGHRFRVISLTDNLPWITALANDLSYQDVFSEQLANLARPGDLLLAISGSGNSENVLRAVRDANSIGCHTIGLAGFGGGRLREEVRECVEDAHMVVQHILVYFFSQIPRESVPMFSQPV